MSFVSVSLAFGEESRAALTKSFAVSPKRDAPVLTLAALREPDTLTRRLQFSARRWALQQGFKV